VTLGFPLLLLLGLLIAMIALIGWTTWRLTRPPRRTYASALAQGRPAQPDQLPATPARTTPRTFDAWSLRVGTLDLPVWDVPGDGPPEAPIIIFTHGWGDSRIGALSRAHMLMHLASRCILWDMQGHGDAPGTSTLGIHEPAALRLLIERVASTDARPIDPRPIVLLGWSLGAGVSIAALADSQGPWNSPLASRVHGIIAEAPYCLPATPARNMLGVYGLPHQLNLAPALACIGLEAGSGLRWSAAFDRAGRAKHLPCPLLILHGEFDDISPPSDAQAIADAAPRATFHMLPASGHHGIWTHPTMAPHCTTLVHHWLRELGISRA
jgi:pimeloyl-ACP methyl ester carboxylesterase